MGISVKKSLPFPFTFISLPVSWVITLASSLLTTSVAGPQLPFSCFIFSLFATYPIPQSQESTRRVPPSISNHNFFSLRTARFYRYPYLASYHDFSFFFSSLVLSSLDWNNSTAETIIKVTILHFCTFSSYSSINCLSPSAVRLFWSPKFSS